MEEQIIESEKKYWHGMEIHDYEIVKNLTRFPCIVAGKSGVQSVDEPSFKKMFESGESYKMKVINITDIKTQMIVADSAIIAYLIELDTAVDNQKSQMKCACTSTWVKENNNWVCALHTETELSQ